MVPPTRLEPCPVKGERVSSLHSASGPEAVLTCRLLWIPLQFLSLSQLIRRGEAVRNTDCQLLCFEGDCNGQVSLYISLIKELFLLSKKT